MFSFQIKRFFSFKLAGTCAFDDVCYAQSWPGLTFLLVTASPALVRLTGETQALSVICNDLSSLLFDCGYF